MAVKISAYNHIVNFLLALLVARKATFYAPNKGWSKANRAVFYFVYIILFVNYEKFNNPVKHLRWRQRKPCFCQQFFRFVKRQLKRYGKSNGSLLAGTVIFILADFIKQPAVNVCKVVTFGIRHAFFVNLLFDNFSSCLAWFIRTSEFSFKSERTEESFAKPISFAIHLSSNHLLEEIFALATSSARRSSFANDFAYGIEWWLKPMAFCNFGITHTQTFQFIHSTQKISTMLIRIITRSPRITTGTAGHSIMHQNFFCNRIHKLALLFFDFVNYFVKCNNFIHDRNDDF